MIRKTHCSFVMIALALMLFVLCSVEFSYAATAEEIDAGVDAALDEFKQN